MKRTFKIDELRKAGFVVKSNYKDGEDVVTMRNGKPFKLWVGGNRDAHLAVKDVTEVKIDKDFDTATYDIRGKYAGTIFEFKKITPRSYGYDLSMR